jgi:hypothetical protein
MNDCGEQWDPVEHDTEVRPPVLMPAAAGLSLAGDLDAGARAAPASGG